TANSVLEDEQEEGLPAVSLSKKKKKKIAPEGQQTYLKEMKTSLRNDKGDDAAESGGAGSKRPSQTPERSEPVPTKRPLVAFPDKVKFDYDEDAPLAYNDEWCAELFRQIRGGMSDMPPVKKLLFKEAYIDTARASNQGNMNFVIERYDTALRKVLAEIREKNAVMQRMSQREREFFSRVVNERDTVVAREAALKDEFAEKCKGMMDELKSSQEMLPIAKESSHAGLETALPNLIGSREGMLEISDSSVPDPDGTEVSDSPSVSRHEEGEKEKTRSSEGQEREANVDPPAPAAIQTEDPQKAIVRREG
ncbi:unnamed protein product, partial [Brassica oleracea]